MSFVDFVYLNVKIYHELLNINEIRILVVYLCKFIVVCVRIKNLDLENTLENLRKDKRKYCDIERLIENGMIPQNKKADGMIEILSTAFGEKPEVLRKKIETEISSVSSSNCLFITPLNNFFLQLFELN